MAGLDADIEFGFRHVYSTNRLLHGNLPCPYDWNSSDCSVVRDMAKIPKLIRGCSRRGNGRLRHAPWPVATGQGAKSLSLHNCSPCRYKGSVSAERTPHPALRATFSHKGRRETRVAVQPGQGGPPVMRLRCAAVGGRFERAASRSRI